MFSIRQLLPAACGLLLAVPPAGGCMAADDDPPGPKVDAEAKDFELAALDGEPFKLAEAAEKAPVVLVFLRGYPGYQCPVCTAQVGDYLGKAAKFEKAGATVAFVYPGPSDGLKAHAEEFVRGKTIPKNVYLIPDPDYVVTNAYGLRWDEPDETAYPSAFVLDRDRTIRFAKVSTTHGGRAKASEALEALSKIGR